MYQNLFKLTWESTMNDKKWKECKTQDTRNATKLVKGKKQLPFEKGLSENDISWKYINSRIFLIRDSMSRIRIIFYW